MEKKLLLDEMLKKTCTWLRIFGVECRHEKGLKDEELLDIAEKGGYILATKDGRLAEMCQKRGVQAILVKGGGIEAEVAQVVQEAGIELGFPENTRCPACGSLLRTAGKEEAKGKVPEAVHRENSEYWICDGCGKAYWRGGHWKNITRIFGNVAERLKQTNKKP
jgi:uncharacterized protein